MFVVTHMLVSGTIYGVAFWKTPTLKSNTSSNPWFATSWLSVPFLNLRNVGYSNRLKEKFTLLSAR